MGDLWSARFFFLAAWWVRYFFYSSARIFFYYIRVLPTSACRKFFFKITHPLPQELNGRPLNSIVVNQPMRYDLIKNSCMRQKKPFNVLFQIIITCFGLLKSSMTMRHQQFCYHNELWSIISRINEGKFYLTGNVDMEKEGLAGSITGDCACSHQGV